mgnify:CR=1 FL=1
MNGNWKCWISFPYNVPCAFHASRNVVYLIGVAKHASLGIGVADVKKTIITTIMPATIVITIENIIFISSFDIIY